MKILNSIEDYSILYFYWGRETSEIITILKPKKNIKIILRLHGFDLYEERNNNYIPYRSSQLKKTDIVLFVSQNGHNYLLNRYNKINFKGHISRLGTVFEGLSKASEDNILRVFSCSSVIPLKRVELIGQALFKLNIGVIWTHIGGGEQFDKLKNFVVQSPKNITVILKGQVKSSRIKRIYIDNCSDLFINVSTTEGVPVSIMEALSAGIPVLATNVGGTSELIDDKVGKLLPSELTANELSDEILSFYNLPFKKKQELRIHAFNRFKERCDAADLALKLSDYLSNI
jgi:glycosyltransferase involved in cell wall biosynthesis